jgi:hypothetical protein
MKFSLLLLALAGFLLSNCKSNRDCCTPPPPLFSNRSELGTIENSALNETSGIVNSRSSTDKWWAHNDSGGGNKIFLLGSNGKNWGEFTLEGINNRDWEDMATVADGGKNYILVGDIGDNNAQYNAYFIYKFEEPNVSNLTNATNQTIAQANIQKIEFQYSDGKRDAETLITDPITKDIYIISKREAQVGIYRLPYPQSTSAVLTAEKIGTLPYSLIVGGDISPDGKEVLLKTYDKVLYWRRDNSTITLASLWQSAAQELPYTAEPQGESIAWQTDLSGYLTLSEDLGSKAKLYFYRRQP